MLYLSLFVSLSLIKLCLAPFARHVLFIVYFCGSLRNMTIKKGDVLLELIDVAIFTMLHPIPITVRIPISLLVF